MKKPHGHLAHARFGPRLKKLAWRLGCPKCNPRQKTGRCAPACRHRDRSRPSLQLHPKRCAWCVRHRASPAPSNDRSVNHWSAAIQRPRPVVQNPRRKRAPDCHQQFCRQSRPPHRGRQCRQWCWQQTRPVGACVQQHFPAWRLRCRVQPVTWRLSGCRELLARHR